MLRLYCLISLSIYLRIYFLYSYFTFRNFPLVWCPRLFFTACKLGFDTYYSIHSLIVSLSLCILCHLTLATLLSRTGIELRRCSFNNGPHSLRLDVSQESWVEYTKLRLRDTCKLPRRSIIGQVTQRQD